MKKIVFLIITAVAIAAGAGAAAIECDQQAAEKIYPYPQEACLGPAAPLPDSVSVEFMAGINLPGDIYQRYVAWLEDQGVSIDDSSENSITFTPASQKHDSEFRQEGYEIAIDTDPLDIRVSAAAETGFLYALFTLQDMTGENGIIHTGTVDDWPVFDYRGVLEGGYSVWGHEQRVDIIEWTGRMKMNVFMYGPKEGHFYRRRWREPFDEKALAEFREYVETARKNRVAFNLAISPALSIEYSNPEEMELLIAKFRQIQELGVKQFSIFFDDVLPILAHESDRQVYDHIAEAEAEVTNKLLAALRENDPGARLAYCPRQYWGWHPTEYIAILREKLDPGIPIGWTGEHIGSKKVTVSDVENFIEVWGRPPAIGENFSPFGPLRRREPGISELFNSYLNNPYAFADDDEAQLSKFIDATIGDFAWNPYGYQPERSMLQGTRQLAATNKEKNALVLALALNKQPDIESDLLEQLKQLAAGIENGDAGAAADFAAQIENAGLAGGFPRDTLNPLLAEQLKPGYELAEEKITTAYEAAKKIAAGSGGDDEIETIKSALEKGDIRLY